MSDKKLLRDYFPNIKSAEFLIEAGQQTDARRVLGRFPLGFPDFEDTARKNWNLTRYSDNAETGEPGGWMLEDNPGSQTHKGTPTSTQDLRNFVILKKTSEGRMKIEFLDEAFNFRPTIRHRVYTLEEAESLMAAKRKPKLVSALKAQFDANEKKSLPAGKASKEESDSDENEGEETQKKVKKAKKIVVENEDPQRETRAARTLRDVIATDALIEEIKPENVEDWEYNEENDDDDLNMGEGDFAEEEQFELEAEYKKYAGSDTSEDELDERGKQLKKLIKKGPTLTAATPKEPAKEIPKETGKETPKETSKELSKAELLQFLKSSGPLPLKDLIDSFKPLIKTKDQHHQFIQIIKEIASFDERGGSRVVVLRKGYH